MRAIRVMVSNWAIALDFFMSRMAVLFEPLRLSLIGCGYRQIELFPTDVAPL